MLIFTYLYFNQRPHIYGWESWEPAQSYDKLPKILWTYWDDPDKLPKSVQMCMESWSKYNPNYEIKLLTKKNYSEYVDIPNRITESPNFNDFPARFADLVRINVLAKYGGVWIDSTTLLKESLDKWLFPRQVEFSGFYIDSFTTDKKSPIIENWFFACIKDSEFMKLWRDEFMKMADYPTVRDYVNSRKDMGINLQKMVIPEYLAMHVSAQKVLQIDKYNLDNLILKKAEDGPFNYLVYGNWKLKRSLKLACKNKKYQYPIMKIRGGERKILEEGLNSYLSIENCGWLDP
jgi:hypothetical protein